MVQYEKYVSCHDIELPQKKIHGKSCNHRLQLLPNLFALGVAISPIIFKYGELGIEQLSNQIFLSVQANKLDDLQQY